MRHLHKINPYIRINVLALVFLIFIISQMHAVFGQAAPTSTTGNVYYVATTGSDSNPGTITAPFRTIQKAADVVSSGDMVLVMPGTYNNPVTTNKHGTASARIRFVSQQKWGAKIQTAGVPYIWTNKADYVNIEGFDISGDGKIGILNYASHTQVLGNHVHHLGRADCGDWGTGDMGAAIDTAGSGATSPRDATDNDIIGNLVHDHSYNCPRVSGISGAHGIYHGYGSGIISNNIVYRVMSYGFHLYHHPYNTDIVNNIAFNNRAAGFIVGSDGGVGSTVHDIYVANNIFYDNDWVGIAVYGLGSGSSNIRFNNNLLYGNSQGYGFNYGGSPDLVTISGDVLADPQFVNYQPDGSGDYHLKPTSPAIDKGIAFTKISEDFDGVQRPVGSAYDIGAYEYGGTATTQTTGNTYYISPTGSDSNPGTSASPWKTFAFTIPKLKAGDTLILKDGTYNAHGVFAGRRISPANHDAQL
ncbi:DUF1565 domain-containing protein [Candidatus Woesearchaeota archaeon]|nr:DUF1565 domain-containing protein [Candidatus Woesearchaeota archaeon]